MAASDIAAPTSPPLPAIETLVCADLDYAATLPEAGQKIIHVTKAGHASNLTIDLCPAQGMPPVTVYLYDAPPMAAMKYQAPWGYGAQSRIVASTSPSIHMHIHT